MMLLTVRGAYGPWTRDLKCYLPQSKGHSVPPMQAGFGKTLLLIDRPFRKQRLREFNMLLALRQASLISIVLSSVSFCLPSSLA